VLALLSADSSLKALLSPSKKRARSIARGDSRNQLPGVLFSTLFAGISLWGSDIDLDGGIVGLRVPLIRPTPSSSDEYDD
ncbi:hypothetical protein, partial [Janthinobacterium sp. KBS0711]|uniref:hypothetical protein n=1 Tax=Janthinobacterium sp. KBS0711 TaxID=1649647 RepID=UPI001F287C56